jgi:hypothetical protein
MRQVLEAIGVHIVLSGDAKRVRDDYLDILVSLPFQAETNTGFGILVKTYLDAATFHNGDDITPENAKSESVAVAKRDALSFIEQSFSSVKTPLQEVERGFRFWDTVSACLSELIHKIVIAIRSLVQNQPPSSLPIVSPTIAKEFEAADAWLKLMRP